MALDSDLVIVVDDQDNKIERIPASEFDHSKRRRDISIFLFNSKGEILIAKRHESKKILPNCWGPTASGTVEAHETYEENAYKELEEEIGISGVNLTFQGNFILDYDDNIRRATGFYTGYYDGGIDNLPLEENQVSEIRWISVAGLVKELSDGKIEYVPKLEYLMSAAGLSTHKPVEFTAIVDEDDTVICYKDRYKLNVNDIPRIVVVWLETSKGEALIHKRSMSKKAGPGRWENAAGGGVAHNQTYEQAAYAELEEELGISGVSLEFVTKNIVHTDKGNRMCAWYKGICELSVDKLTLEEENVVEAKWIDKQELFDLRDKSPETYMPSSIYWRELFSISN